MRRTREQVITELVKTRADLHELRRQLSQSSSEREQELRETLRKVVAPEPARGPRARVQAEQAWREAIAHGRELVG